MPTEFQIPARRRARRFREAAVAVASLCLVGEALAEEPRGAVIYREQCAECHGANGEGVPGEFEDALLGDRSIKSLTKLITKTMPEEEPDACVGEDAEAVADYIFHAFYSAEARGRLGRVAESRIEVTRMTVGQYRNAVADLVGGFDPKGREQVPDDGQRGFQGEYFSSNGMNKKEKHQLKRVDARLDFNFGGHSPGEGMSADQFSIAWDGSFFAPDDGTYEFRIRTPNGARLYVNADLKPGDFNFRDDSSEASRVPLIDAWVSSGNADREETAKVLLLGGRRYPLRLDYFKYKEKTGAIRLEWKPPHGVWEVLGGEHDVRPVMTPRVFVATTPFPADDASLGYERGSSVSREWLEAATKGALETADEVLDRLDAFAGLRSREGGGNRRRNRERNREENQEEKQEENPGKIRDEKAREFCGRFIENAFRRPVPERDALVEGIFKASADTETAVKRCVLYALTAPRFLYPELPRGNEATDGHDVASRLSFTLWDSLPDQELWDAAARNELQTPEQIDAQARRMLPDPRTKAKMRRFFEHWLEMDARDLVKDGGLFPGFDEGAVASLRKSLQLFLEDVVWSETSDYRQLLTADYLYMDERLRNFYGGEKAGDGPAGFERIRNQPDNRAGVLTHPYLLSAFAYHNDTSPIHRGVFLTRNIAGRMLKPPPKAVAFKNDEFDPAMTMREKVTQLTSDAACMSCHSVINPLGFSLENFDAVGRWREADNRKPVDPRSEYTTLEGETITLQSARDIAGFAVESEDAHRAFVVALFHHMVKQSIDAYGATTLTSLRETFEGDAYNMTNLLARIARVASQAEAAGAPKPVSTTTTTNDQPS